ncbi:nicotinamide N-methyltransferase [Sarracenia purpurea var. burkii]
MGEKRKRWCRGNGNDRGMTGGEEEEVGGSDVRHGPGFHSCSLRMEFGEDGHEVAVVQLSEDDQGLAAGQFAAFYHGRTCLGSGMILESWDDQGFPVCAKALEVATMRDISELGKPVKIKSKQEAFV